MIDPEADFNNNGWVDVEDTIGNIKF